MGTIERIVDDDDPRVSAYRNLREPELLRAEQLFVAEGRLVVRRAIESGRYRMRSLLVNEAALRELRSAVDALDPDVPVYVCGMRDFLGITGFNIHRGCLALVERPAPRSMAAALADASRVVVLEGVGNPDNVGGVFRNAAAFGAAVVLGPGCADPFYRKAIRTSMGAVLTVPFATAGAWPASLAEIHRAGFTIVALTPRASVSITEWQAERTGQGSRIALVIGTEGEGLSPEADSLADVRVRIPMTDAVDSLNLAVAAGIALFVTSVPRG